MNPLHREGLIELLDRPDVQWILSQESLKRTKLEPFRLWRIGVITPDNDDVRTPLYPSKFVTIGLQPRSSEEIFQEISMPTIMFGKEGSGDTLEAAASALQDFLWERHSLKTARDGWLCQHKVRGRVGKDGWISVPNGVEVEAVGSFSEYVPLPEFLRGEDFAITNLSSIDPSIFTMEVSGLVAMNGESKLGVMRDPYFIRRSLVDDEGNLIYLGLDMLETEYPAAPESTSRYAPFPVYFLPGVRHQLFEKYGSDTMLYAKYRHIMPLFRYTYFPITTETFLPLLDMPLTSERWVDVFVRPDGMAYIYFLKPGVLFGHLELELRSLWEMELNKKNHHLLMFTKDIAHVESYLQTKMQILKEAFEVVEVRIWPKMGK